jgi:peptidoglycan hydrolase-like protein with peptidoglycan-binding domain
MTLGEINDAVSEIDGQAALEAFASSSRSLSMADLNKQPLLCLTIQRRLRGLGLYPGGKLVDGDFGPRSQKALERFCTDDAIKLEVPTPLQFKSEMAQKLLDTQQIPSILEEAKNSKTVSVSFFRFQNNVKANIDKLGFLDMGARFSPFKKHVHQHIDFLAATKTIGIRTVTPSSLSFASYPDRGQLPVIDENKLEFLKNYTTIKQACICLGSFENNEVTASWLGKNGLSLVECWSASKIIPILNVQIIPMI